MTGKYIFDERRLCIRVNGTICSSVYDYFVIVATPDGKYSSSCFFDGDTGRFVFHRTAQRNCEKAIEEATEALREMINKDNALLVLKEYETTVFPDITHAKTVNVQLERLK